MVRTEITLKNAGDEILALNGHLEKKDLRQTSLVALVDTGAWTLVINEAVRQQLGLAVTRTETSTLADGTQSAYTLVGPVEVAWKDRSIICEAIVLPNAEEALLGAIPLEGMDLTVNPRTEEVVGVHGDQIIHSVKRYTKAPLRVYR